MLVVVERVWGGSLRRGGVAGDELDYVVGTGLFEGLAREDGR